MRRQAKGSGLLCARKRARGRLMTPPPQLRTAALRPQQKTPNGPSGCDGMRAKEIWPPRS